MKNIVILLTSSIILAACYQSSKSNYLENDTSKIKSANLFTLSDAEKILGESAQLTDSSTNSNEGVLTFQLAYKAIAEDSISKKTGTVYFLINEYASPEGAKTRYSTIKKANENHGIKVIDDLGDEAYFHSDNENFYFIMARKGSKVFNMKVNKITSNTSLEQFNIIAGKIITLL
jgi:hypothetical protein